MTGRRRIVGLLLAAAGSLGWLDPSAAPRAAARLYVEGKFDEAATQYNQALTDDPDSALLHFNLGDTEYRRRKYEEAGRAFALVPQDAAALYNQGNALFRQGEQAAQEKPQDALGKWAEALVAYRRAIALDPSDEDAKFNYEWVSRKIEELRRKLEEQQQQQDQNQQGQQDQQNQHEQQQQGEQPPEDRGQEGQQDQAEEQGEQPPEPQRGERQDGQPPEPSQAAGGEAEPEGGELSRDEATALLDGERNEELRPDEVIRRQLGTGEAPVQDW